MEKLTIEIEMNNDALVDNHNSEIARILSQLVDKLDNYEIYLNAQQNINIRDVICELYCVDPKTARLIRKIWKINVRSDVNGNTCGSLKVEGC